MTDECGTFTMTREAGEALMAAANKQRADREARLPDNAAAIRAVFDGWLRLTEMGWRDAIYAPRDNSPLLLIEAGSTGIHKGYRDDIGYWVVDDDVWPSHPILWRADESSVAPTGEAQSLGVQTVPQKDGR